MWQPKYWEHQIRDAEDYEAHFDYLHYNPAKHGHAAAVGDWAWSSFHRHVRGGVYPENWGQGDMSARFDRIRATVGE